MKGSTATPSLYVVLLLLIVVGNLNLREWVGLQWHNIQGRYEVKPPVFSQKLITIIMKFTYIMGAFLTKFKLLFHQVSFIINTLFPPLHQMLYAGHIKLFGDTSELFTHTHTHTHTHTLSLSLSLSVPAHRCLQNSVLGVNLLEGQNDGSYRVQIGSVGRMRENSPPHVAVASFVHTLVCSLALSCRRRTSFILLFGSTL